MAKRTIRSQIIQGLGLLLFLVILPGGSWYYLKSGLDYRRAILNDLADHGPLPVADFADGFEGLPDTLAERVVVSAFVSSTLGDEALGGLLQRLYDQFRVRTDVIFLLHAVPDAPDAFGRTYGLQGMPQCYFVAHSAQGLDSLARQGYALPLPAGTRPDGYVALTDIRGRIRRHYAVADPDQTKRLVEHIALLTPVTKREKIELKRATEK